MFVLLDWLEVRTENKTHKFCLIFFLKYGLRLLLVHFANMHESNDKLYLQIILCNPETRCKNTMNGPFYHSFSKPTLIIIPMYTFIHQTFYELKANHGFSVKLYRQWHFEIQHYSLMRLRFLHNPVDRQHKNHPIQVHQPKNQIMSVD